jgi:hypothetical protein
VTAPERRLQRQRRHRADRGPYYQWTSKINGKTITRRLTEAEASLYQEWITNDRTLRALIAEMRQIAAHTTELIMQDADDQRAGV